MTVYQLLQSIGETKTLNKGYIIFNEGDFGEDMYIVLKGKVAINIGNQPVREFQEGDFFGEMSLFEDLPRSATAVTATEAVVLSIHRAEIEKLVSLAPSIALKMLRSLSQRVRTLNQSVYNSPIESL